MKKNQLLSFHTTIRNPKRYEEFLEIIKIFENSRHDKNLLHNIARELIINGIFKPNGANKSVKEKWKNKERLSSSEVEEIMETSRQKLSWESRASSHLKPLLELAFIKIDNKVLTITENGRRLEKLKEDNEVNNFWTRLLLKFQFGNPFRKSAKKTNPFLLTLLVIDLVNNKWKKLNREESGITKAEFGYFVLSASNNDCKFIADKIIDNRIKNGVSNNFDKKCFVQFLSQKTVTDESKINCDTVKAYADNVIRHFLLTGLITFGDDVKFRFIDLSKRYAEEIKNIVKTIELKWKEFSVEEYINHLLKDDIRIEWKKEIIDKVTLIKKFIEKNKITLLKVKEELLLFYGNRKKKESHFLFLKEAGVKDSLKLEFLTAIIFIITFEKDNNIKISPNLLINENGIPYYHAPGGKGDIEINYKNDFNFLVEVTLQMSKSGQESEITSIVRHERELKNKTNLITYTAFMAPRIHEDVFENLKWRLSKKDHKFDYYIFSMSIKKFVDWFVIINNSFKNKVEKIFSDFRDNKTEDLDKIFN